MSDELYQRYVPGKLYSVTASCVVFVRPNMDCYDYLFIVGDTRDVLIAMYLGFQKWAPDFGAGPPKEKATFHTFLLKDSLVTFSDPGLDSMARVP